MVKRLSAAVAAILILSACGAPSSSAHLTPTASPSLSATAVSTTAADTTASASRTPGVDSSPSPTPTPTPISVACKTGITRTSLLLIGHHPATGSLLYEVSDPIHPKLVCRITGTSAHIVDANAIAYIRPVSPTETDIVLRSLQTDEDAVGASLPFALPNDPWQSLSWRPDGSLVAYSVQPTEANPGSQITVWLYASHAAMPLMTYPLPITDCICRFGLPDPTSELSPDGQYLVSGWPIGKGAAPFVVSRVANRSQVTTFDLSVVSVLWDRTGHRLFLIGQKSVRAWTPEGGITALAGTSQWSYMPSVSPDGHRAVYTAYVDDMQTQLRVFIYDFDSAKTRMLSDQSRSQALFVNSGWFWYLDEPTCNQSQSTCGPWGTAPSGRVFAQELATGHESEVTFSAGEAAITPSDWGTFEAQDLWPAS